MNRPALWRALLALLVLGTTGWFAYDKEPNLGLDLRGGTQIVLETQDSPTQEADEEATQRAVQVLDRRVNALGIAESTVVPSGTNRIIIELPGVDDPAAAEEAVGRTAQLTFHPVLGPGDVTALPPEQQDDVVPDPVPVPDVVPTGEPADPASPAAEPAPTTSPTAAGVVDAPAMEPVSNSQPLAQASTPTPAATPAAPPAATSSPSAGPEPGTDLAVEQFNPALESQTLLSDQGDPILVGPADLTGEGVESAAATADQTTGTRRFVSIDFTGEGGRLWEQLTAQAACQPLGDDRRRVAIVLDGEVITSPQVNPDVQCGVGIQGGRTQITGDFTLEEASELAALIEGGALPVPVTTISRSYVGPTLGEDAIDASVKAGIIGVALTGLFLVVVYRLAGFLAAVALASYGVISYGALVALGATLTLPGLGGLLLSAGLAIDANVLVYERAREEYAAQRTPRLISALDNGYRNAFSAIADSNITTLLAAVLLFFLAAGPVRGFGVTLTLGVISSMVSALLVTRVLAEFAVKRGIVFRRPRLTGLAHLGRFREYLTRRDPDLMSRRRTWLTISVVLVLVAVAGMLVRGFNFGVEFTGGRVVEYTTAQEFSVGDVRTAVREAGVEDAVVQESGEREDPNVSIRTGDVSPEDERRITAAVQSVVSDADLLRDDTIGASFGSELRAKAVIALLIALLAQLLYLAFRFRWAFASAAVLAMFHDVLIVVGAFAWLGRPIDSVFLAAALTIIGVSINDSIVTLDRIRETWGAHRTKPLPGIVNSAILQTAPRTINTGLGAMFILAALAVLGGDTLQDFALALLIGLVVGTYSSAFTASPLLLLLEQRSKQPAPMPKKKAGYSSAARRRGPQPIFQTRGGGAVR
jgi:SecD/SecF fusion protein